MEKLFFLVHYGSEEKQLRLFANTDADEYLTKPFRKERLLVRIENVLKRYEGRENLLEKDNFLLDMNTYILYIDGDSVLLPQNQGKLLEVFMTADQALVTKEELCLKLWNTTEFSMKMRFKLTSRD